IYIHLEEISKKSIRESLRENRHLADMSKALATIKTDCDIALDYEEVIQSKNKEYEIRVNSIRSIYGKEHHNTPVNRLKDGKGLYVDMEKADSWRRAAGVQFPGAGDIRISNPNITLVNENFKPQNEKSSRNSVSPEADAEYLAAVERGDMETAQRMVEEAARAKGYSADDNWRLGHRAPNSRLVAEDPDGPTQRITDWKKVVPEDYFDHPDWYTSSPEERESFFALKRALDLYEQRKAEGRGREKYVGLRVYRAVDKTVNSKESEFRNGDWVTPSKTYAEMEGEGNPDGSRIIMHWVPLEHLYWNGDSIAELGYDDGKSYAYADTKNNRKLLDPVTYDDDGNVIPLSKRFNKRSDDVRFSVAPDEELELDRVNQAFNSELQKQINGELPKGYLYQLGRPGSILRSTGIPDLPIELSSTRLAEKAKTAHHPFNIEDVKDLPLYLNKPIGVFEYGNKDSAQNIVVEIQKGDKYFIVGLFLNFEHNSLIVNSIHGLYPKDTHEWLTWIQKNKSLYLNKEKIQALIAQQRRNPADVNYLDLDLISKIVRDFQNASVDEENSSRLSVAPDDAFVQAWAKVLLPVVSTQYINVDGAAAYLMDHGIEVYAGRDDDTLRKACVLFQIFVLYRIDW
ncbi:MAG: hypothetical protein J6S98_07495, partial [Lentisphaeria bacterium]|nr:hypothetical protein [Lentisphaeria bacterium]